MRTVRMEVIPERSGWKMHILMHCWRESTREVRCIDSSRKPVRYDMVRTKLLPDSAQGCAGIDRP